LDSIYNFAGAIVFGFSECHILFEHRDDVIGLSKLE